MAALIEAVGNAFLPKTVINKIDPRRPLKPGLIDAEKVEASETDGKDAVVVEELDLSFKKEDNVGGGGGSSTDIGGDVSKISSSGVVSMEIVSTSMGKAYIGKEGDIALFEKAFHEIERYRAFDRNIPSYHNVVTVSCLEVNFN